MLNLFSYSGAFSVAALAGGAGARSTWTPRPRRSRSRGSTAARTGFAAADEDFVEADVFDGRAAPRRRGTSAGTSSSAIRPPSRRKRADVDRAARGYKDVNRLAMASSRREDGS